MKKNLIIVKTGACLTWLLLVACGDEEKKNAKGFALPEGDIARGKIAFTEMKCHNCHTVAGVILPDSSEGPKLKISIHLGGEVRKVKTYGQLVTSIINPKHVISPEYLETLKGDELKGAVSPMPSMNDFMTVSQMIDIVEFLHMSYVKLTPDYNEYRGPYDDLYGL